MDFVFCCEFNYGAMENVGCITFNDNYVTRDVPTLASKANICNTVYHEISHMWFGNLVTMK